MNGLSGFLLLGGDFHLGRFDESWSRLRFDRFLGLGVGWSEQYLGFRKQVGIGVAWHSVMVRRCKTQGEAAQSPRG
ncbi:MAG: hypothetical protein PW789_11060 [Edaphobacter sp.]|uniref:hypothetical protein n=1 Tax=Edaphobacter sp. TaxID=1934404 RepID=UPI0023870AB6|nr:hypothetical protein [Edaphobacter sp.]MDE1177125.1 hypothetical protein [Edaphobacter sp.]